MAKATTKKRPIAASNKKTTQKNKANKASSVIVEAKRYKASEFPTISQEDFREKMAIPLSVKVTEKGKKPRTVENKVYGNVVIMKLVGKGKRARLVPTRRFVKNAEAFRKLAASDEFKKAKLYESGPMDLFALGGPADVGIGGNVSANDQFHPILGGPFNKQLYLFDYLDMHSKAFAAKNHNPLAKQAIDVITNFSIGKGVKIVFKSEHVQAVWNAYEKRTKFQERQQTNADALTWAGEIMDWKKIEHGRPVMKSIDPSTIWEIVTEPTDITNIYYYHQQYPTQWQLIYHADDVVSQYIVNDIPAHEVIHTKINSVSGEKRGRSDLFTVLDWLKRFNDYYQAKVIKAQIEESFAIRKTIKGSPADVEAFANDAQLNSNPPPGSVIFENESVKTDFMVPTASSTGGRDNTGEQIRSIVATGLGLSPEYLGVSSMSSARATALQHSEPSARKFEKRQMVQEGHISQEVEWVIGVERKAGRIPKETAVPSSWIGLKQAIRGRDIAAAIEQIKGMLTKEPTMEPTNLSFEVVFPEISTDDRAAKIKDVQGAQAGKHISHERASTMIAKELAITNYSYEAEQQDIAEQDEALNAAAMASLYKPSASADSTKPGSAEDNEAFRKAQGRP